jgi:hypothetical protein
MITRQGEYMELVERFLAQELDGTAFAKEFLKKRRRDGNKDDDIARSWPARYDLQIFDELGQGTITLAEFDRRWQELWGYSLQDPFIKFVGRLFTEIESYEPDEEIYRGLADEHPEWYFQTDEELRRRVERHFEEFSEAIHPSPEQ